MVNDRIGTLEARLTALETRLDSRSANRDAEIAEITSDLAVTVNEQNALKGRLADIAAAVGAIRDVQPPSVIALWGPALASAIALGSLAGFILDARLTPIVEDVRVNKATIRDVSGLYGAVARDNEAQRTKLEWHRSWLEQLQKRIDDATSELTETRVHEEARQH